MILVPMTESILPPSAVCTHCSEQKGLIEMKTRVISPPDTLVRKIYLMAKFVSFHSDLPVMPMR